MRTQNLFESIYRAVVSEVDAEYNGGNGPRRKQGREGSWKAEMEGFREVARAKWASAGEFGDGMNEKTYQKDSKDVQKPKRIMTRQRRAQPRKGPLQRGGKEKGERECFIGVGVRLPKQQAAAQPRPRSKLRLEQDHIENSRNNWQLPTISGKRTS